MFFAIFEILALFSLIEILTTRFRMDENGCYNAGRSRFDFWWLSMLIFVIVFDGFKKYHLFPDQAGYEYNLLTLDFTEGRNNYGYMLLNILVHDIYKSYTFLSVIMATFIMSAYAYCFKRYSPYKWLSFFLFFITNYIMAMLAVRQYIAMAICVLSIKYIYQREQFKFLLLIFAAFMFHSTAAVALPIYYIYGISYTRRNRILLAVGAILSAFLFQAAVKIFLNKVATDYAFYVSDYEDNADGTASWERPLSKLFILGVYLYTLRGRVFNQGINLLVLINMILSFVICAGGVGLFGIFRLKEYFLLGDVIGIPLIIYYSRHKPVLTKIICILSVAVYIALLLYSFVGVYKQNFVYGYKFIWE